MYSFVVLGLIPGTNIQITFQMWLTIAGLAAIAFGMHKLVELHRNLLAMTKLRVPLPATRLHLRG
jgi:hypothetical protein